MRRINWVTSIFLLTTPVIAAVWGAARIAEHGIEWGPVAACLVLLAASGLSITGGYHRLFAHGAYEASRPVKIFYLLFGAAAMQNSVIWWASGHRTHHRSIDQDEDPYNIQEGFWWAHIGWLLKQKQITDFSNVKDLNADPLVRWQHKAYYPLAVAMAFGLPLAIGWAAGNPWGYLLWAGVIRIVAIHHSTFLVNSLAHYIGRRPYCRKISARDSFVTALLTFGEGYHNFHHKFATDYRNGIRWYQWDPTKWLIQTLSAMGHAWDLYSSPRDRIVAAEIACATESVLDRWRDRSENAAAYIRSRVTEMGESFQHAADRLAELEGEAQKLRTALRDERKRRMETLRREIRDARREFHEARARWRETVAELSRSPLPQPA